MDVPRINAVGVVEMPESFEAPPRRPPRAIRIVAAVLLVAFSIVVVATTIYSVGAYCLTSGGAPWRSPAP